jgi:hypothetical protein
VGRPLQVDHNIAFRLRATNQQIAVCGCVQRVGPIADRACHESGLAGVTNPGSTSPPYGDIAGLSQLEQALE